MSADSASNGIKRQVTPDSVIDSVMGVGAPTRHAKRKATVPLEILEAEFVSAEVALRKAAVRTPEYVGSVRTCQVCHLSSDKWFCRLPLYLNERGESVNLPGSFCSKACFEHI